LAYKGWGMRLRDAIFAVFGAMLASSQAVAGTYSASPFSNVIAADIVPNQDDLQLIFSVRAGTFWGDEMDAVAPSDGVYYQYLGTVEILVGDAKKNTLCRRGYIHTCWNQISLEGDWHPSATNIPSIPNLADARTRTGRSNRRNVRRGLPITLSPSRSDAGPEPAQPRQSPGAAAIGV